MLSYTKSDTLRNFESHFPPFELDDEKRLTLRQHLSITLISVAAKLSRSETLMISLFDAYIFVIFQFLGS